jgi:hypothetical protein
MGLLDDAIREHLDLKRLHGASDDEIAQKEAEALGPARREFPSAAEEDVSVEDVAVEDAPAHLPEEPADERFHTFGDPLSEEIAEPPVFDPSASPDGAAPAEPARHGGLADTEEYRFEDDEDDDFTSDDDDDLEDDDDGSSELEEEDEDDEDADEDLLQDTPEFLQDTPEHDRLWFEQKPPRDFDFE